MLFGLPLLIAMKGIHSILLLVSSFVFILQEPSTVLDERDSSPPKVIFAIGTGMP